MKEIERAWKMVEASHEKEQRAKETIHNLKIEISNLSRLVEQGAGLSINQENTVSNLRQQANDLMRTRDELQDKVQTLTQQNVDASEKLQNLEAEKHATESEMQNLRDLLASKKTEGEREHRRKERLERELGELRSALEQRDATLKEKRAAIQNVADNTARAEQEGREAAKLVEKMEQRMKVHMDEFAMVQSKHKEEQEAKTKLLSAIHELGGVTKSKREEIKTHTAERDKMQKNFDQMRRKKQMEDEGLNDLDRQSAQLKDDLKGMMRQLDRLKTFSERDMKQIQDLRHEHDVLNKNIVKSHDKTKVQKEAVADHEATSTEMREEIKEQKQLLADAMKRAHDMDKQREKYGIELSLQIQKHSHGVEELKNRDNKMSELKKNHADVKGKLAQQKQAYEGVRTDRNLFSKNLVESQDEIAEMKRKFKIMYHQIEQLKEEIKEKDQALIKEQRDHTRMQKVCETIKDQMEKAKKRQAQLQGQKETQQAEIKKLESRLQEAEVDRNSQKRKYEEIISERDILGTQLIRRNDELALLYEKIKIQQRTLQGGEIAYRQRLEESRALAIKSAALRRELQLAGRKVNDIDDFKREVFQLQRELLRERTKVKALSEELENPINVHRWRKLEGADPAMYETIQKVKTLQKRLISKTEEAVEKDLAIQEKEKLYLEMRNLLQKQPGPEVVEQVAKHQQSLKERTKGMKSMAAELNMYHAQLNDYKDEIERLTKELQDTKRRYFEQRRREQLLQDTSRTEKAGAGTGSQAAASRS